MPASGLLRYNNRLRVYRRPFLPFLAVAITVAIVFTAPSALSQERLYRPVDTKGVIGTEAYLRYFQEHYSYYDEDTRGVAAAFVYRDLPKWTLLGEAIFQRKFGFDESFIRLGAAYKFDNGTTIMETIGFPLGSNGTFPDFSTDTEVVHPVTKWAWMHLGYKFVCCVPIETHK